MNAAVMQPQVNVALVRLGAHPTGERLFTSVRSHVHFEVHLQSKSLVADSANERLRGLVDLRRLRVEATVSHQRHPALKALLADLADEHRLAITVDYRRLKICLRQVVTDFLMTSQTSHRLERLAAVSASVRQFASVDENVSKQITLIRCLPTALQTRQRLLTRVQSLMNEASVMGTELFVALLTNTWITVSVPIPLVDGRMTLPHSRLKVLVNSVVHDQRSL